MPDQLLEAGRGLCECTGVVTVQDKGPSSKQTQAKQADPAKERLFINGREDGYTGKVVGDLMGSFRLDQARCDRLMGISPVQLTLFMVRTCLLNIDVEQQVLVKYDGGDNIKAFTD